ncbi:hypothetical protein [Streptomyces sp. NPDC015130]|uniref:hypothetical protein n=1 Tax=Streptomyces sp. NPDC015130 TaxID=3364940 RepID=UPI00370161FB
MRSPASARPPPVGHATWAQRCWDHPGLYAVGCGSMPSVATSNPTLTMAALALRSAGAVARELDARDRPADLVPGAAL